MGEIKSTQTKKHAITLDSRKRMSIEGVTDVISFDEWQVSLVTSCGEMMVEGKNLHISVLELEGGRVVLDGEVDGVFYPDGNEPQKRRGVLGRIFG